MMINASYFFRDLSFPAGGYGAPMTKFLTEDSPRTCLFQRHAASAARWDNTTTVQPRFFGQSYTTIHTRAGTQAHTEFNGMSCALAFYEYKNPSSSFSSSSSWSWSSSSLMLKFAAADAHFSLSAFV